VTAPQVTFTGGRRPGGTLPPVEVSAVDAKEPSPPQGEEPVELLLLTSLPVTEFLHACTVVPWYRCRREIALVFRVVKPGSAHVAYRHGREELWHRYCRSFGEKKRRKAGNGIMLESLG
jgi:hypothetical protein